MDSRRLFHNRGQAVISFSGRQVSATHTHTHRRHRKVARVACPHDVRLSAFRIASPVTQERRGVRQHRARRIARATSAALCVQSMEAGLGCVQRSTCRFRLRSAPLFEGPCVLVALLATAVAGRSHVPWFIAHQPTPRHRGRSIVGSRDSAAKLVSQSGKLVGCMWRLALALSRSWRIAKVCTGASLPTHFPWLPVFLIMSRFPGVGQAVPYK